MVTSNFLRNDRFAVIPIGDLHPFDGCVRRHSAQKHKKLKKSVQTFGQVMPILVDQGGVIVDGHELFNVLQELGYQEVDVAVVSGRSPEDVRALRIAINRLSDEADWDSAKLKREFEDLAAAGYNMDATGFDIAEVEFALDFKVPELDRCDSDYPFPLGPSVTRAGDVWLCDDHRIACADWRNMHDRARLLDGKKASATVFRFSPDAAVGRELGRDVEAAAIDTRDLGHFCEMAADSTEDRGFIYLAMPWRDMNDLFATVETYGLRPVQLCASGIPSQEGGRLYHECAEFVFVLAKIAYADTVRLSAHGRRRGTLWRHRIETIDEHDAPRSLGQSRALLCDLMRDSTKRKGIVFAPALGTGAALLAAEDCGRLCYGADENSQCIDTAIRHWQSETAHVAVRASDGKSFVQCENRDSDGGRPIDV